MVSYITKDISTSAFMWCQSGAKFSQVSEKDRSIYFHFEFENLTEEELNDLLFRYSNRQTMVEPVLYSEHMNRLRQIVRDKTRDRTVR